MKSRILGVGLWAMAALVSIELWASELPGTFLTLAEEKLQVTAGESFTLQLTLPQSESWASANISRFQVRTFPKTESLLPLIEHNIGTTLSYRIQEPGSAMVLLCAGPASTKDRTDAIHLSPYCTKVLLQVTAPSGSTISPHSPFNSPGLTAKAGLKTEVSPYIDPTTFSVEAITQGADLPVRVYYEGIAQKKATVIAYGPGETKQEATTDAMGITRFMINRVGQWLIRYQKEVEGILYTGDLLFYAGPLNKGVE